MGWDHQEKLQLHESQKGKRLGLRLVLIRSSDIKQEIVSALQLFYALLYQGPNGVAQASSNLDHSCRV